LGLSHDFRLNYAAVSDRLKNMEVCSKNSNSAKSLILFSKQPDDSENDDDDVNNEDDE
jgi:hypothetical protein